MNATRNKNKKESDKITDNREQMNVVIVGHVDHGKSTVIGRLLADTGSLPKGKLEAVKENCARNSKPFEYAFLLDALKDEQSQGITIDTARCFFKSANRDYIIIDAPGHIEFLKNMVTGAARAEAAVLVIDAKEGIQENSKRHGYMMSFLGIKNIFVCVNKMDLVDYKQDVYENIKKEYSRFLDEINITPKYFIPISAREGDNIAKLSEKMSWYADVHVLDALDHFQKKAPRHQQAFRFPVQDIYKFTNQGDDRRIFAGRIETGTIGVDEDVIFMPSKKRSKISSIEGFNIPQAQVALAGESTGFCLNTQLYIRPGEMMCKITDKLPHVGNKFKANVFWMGTQPLVKGKTYKLKIASQQVPVILSEIISVLDASELSSIENKSIIDRHDVAECILETVKPVAYDEVSKVSETGRFVIVDNYEISGGGIILSPIFEDSSQLKNLIQQRETSWERSDITPGKRAKKFQHKSALVVITGQKDVGKLKIAKYLEVDLFRKGYNAYFLGVSNQISKAALNVNDNILKKMQHINILGELSHIMTDAGLILITSISDVDEYEIKTLKSLNQPNKSIVVSVGDDDSAEGLSDLKISREEDIQKAVGQISQFLAKNVVLDPEYNI